MPSPVRIGVIGAGSATFTLGLVRDLCLTPNLKGSEVHFMDIDAERLDAVTRMARRYTDEVGARLRFEQTTERAEALRGCDFVIDTVMVQSHHHQAGMRELMGEARLLLPRRLRRLLLPVLRHDGAGRRHGAAVPGGLADPVG